MIIKMNEEQIPKAGFVSCFDQLLCQKVSICFLSGYSSDLGLNIKIKKDKQLTKLIP